MCLFRTPVHHPHLLPRLTSVRGTNLTVKRGRGRGRRQPTANQTAEFLPRTAARKMRRRRRKRERENLGGLLREN